MSCKLIQWNKRAPLVGDVDKGGGDACVGAGDTFEISVYSPQCCFEPKNCSIKIKS